MPPFYRGRFIDDTPRCPVAAATQAVWKLEQRLQTLRPMSIDGVLNIFKPSGKVDRPINLLDGGKSLRQDFSGANIMDQHEIRGNEKSRLSSEIAKHFATAIKEGRFHVGEQIPPERTLSQELGVSRPILREALRMLESRGLVDIRHGRGTFVADAFSELSNVNPHHWLKDNQKLVQEFYEARLVLEPECAALASQQARPQQLDELKKLIDRCDLVVRSGEVTTFIGLDIDFHRLIARMSGNALLYKMLAAIINPDTDLRRVLHQISGHLPVAHERHVHILAAIVHRDAAEARSKMTKALEGTLQDIDQICERR